MKIFAMDPDDPDARYAAATPEAALRQWALDQGADLAGISEKGLVASALAWTYADGPHELSDAEMDQMEFAYESGERQTFRARLAEMISNGDDFPCCFALPCSHKWEDR